MMRKLLTSNSYLLRGSRDILNKGTVNFPFRLGGMDKNIPNQILIQSFFGFDLKQSFIKTYCSLLDSTTNRDETWLKKFVEPKLVSPLLSKQNLKQINSESPIELAFNSIELGMGAKFGRNDSDDYHLLASQLNTVFYMNKNYRPQTKSSPILFTYNLSVRSARKIVSKSQPSNNQAQNHLISIQSEIQVGVQQLKGIIMMNQKSEALKSFKKLYLNEEQSWKIGNIDQFLKKRV